MFCSNCGKELAENSKFCAECGYQLNADTTEEKIAVEGTEATQVEAVENVNILKLLLPIVAVILGVILIFSLTGNKYGASTPEKVAKQYAEALYDYDFEKQINCYAEFTVREVAESSGLPEDASRKDIAKANAYNSNNKIEMTIRECNVNTYSYPEDVISLICELNDATDEEEESITDIREVELILEDSQGYESELTVCCVEIDNRWYVVQR